MFVWNAKRPLCRSMRYNGGRNGRRCASSRFFVHDSRAGILRQPPKFGRARRPCGRAPDNRAFSELESDAENRAAERELVQRLVAVEVVREVAIAERHVTPRESCLGESRRCEYASGKQINACRQTAHFESP